LSFGFSPRPKIYGVQANTENIGWNKAKLSRTKADDADDRAIDGGQDPPLPATLSQQDGRNNRKNAGYVIEPEKH